MNNIVDIKEKEIISLQTLTPDNLFLNNLKKIKPEHIYDNINDNFILDLNIGMGFTNIKNILINGSSKWYGMDKYNIYDLDIFRKNTTYDKDYLVNLLSKKSICEYDNLFIITRVDNNYLHFILGTFVKLYSFSLLKKYVKNIKLVTNKHRNNYNNFKYYTDFLNLLDITKDDIIEIKNNNLFTKNLFTTTYYKKWHLWRPSSSTVIYDKFFSKIREISLKKSKLDVFYDKIYVSRRTWARKEFVNLGEDNTQKRKCLNEDLLVDLLTNKYKFKEFFLENFDIQDKIKLLENSKHIISLMGASLGTYFFIKNKNIINLNNSYKCNFLYEEDLSKYNNFKTYDFSYHKGEGPFTHNMPFYIDLEKLEKVLDTIYL